MKIPKEDRTYLINKLGHLIDCCGGCENCDSDRKSIKKLKVNADLNKIEIDILATQLSVTHTVEEINQIIKTWKEQSPKDK